MSEENNLVGDCKNFHKPGENDKSDGYVTIPITSFLLSKHLEETGGKVVTRFPPEPNGVLHIGHAKAINFNFGYARKQRGITYLRYDDTNPEKEEEKFFNNILEMVQWLGFTAYKITYSSDYFEKLYSLAVKLIKIGSAYICHQKVEEIRGFNKHFSPWRDRPVEESLRLFEDMKHGKINEGEAFLRMKVIMDDGKIDPVAYRVKFVPHHRTKNKWCIYPTYDFTHCICDSLENITHSLCTKEFQNHRSTYYWLCNQLEIYCPVQWEYSRLNISGTVLSKRKIIKLVQLGIVQDWDDPRLYTLSALRRRGFPPESINKLCEDVGVTMSLSSLSPAKLEACVRETLNERAPRTMAVLNPLKLIVKNWPEDIPKKIKVCDFPSDEARGYHEINTSQELFIELDDFSENPGKGYRRLTPDQSVGLRYLGLTVSVVEIVRSGEEGSKIDHLVVKCQKVSDPEFKKPRAFIHWVAKPVYCEVRDYAALFNDKNPDDVPGGYLASVNPDSFIVHQDALIDEYLGVPEPRRQFQFERIGYYCIDTDSTNEKLVFNQTVGLREDLGKNAN